MVNLLVMLVGLSMAGVAVWLLVSEYHYLSSSWSDFSLLSCVALALGLLSSVVAFLACCGAITNSRCLLGMFILFLLAMLVGEVTLALVVYFKVSTALYFHNVFTRSCNHPHLSLLVRALFRRLCSINC